MEKYLKNAYLTWCHIPGTWISQRKHDVSVTDGGSQSISILTLFYILCYLINNYFTHTIQWCDYSNYISRRTKRINHSVMRNGYDHVSIFVNDYHCRVMSTLTESYQETSRHKSCVIQCIRRHRLIYSIPVYGVDYW